MIQSKGGESIKGMSIKDAELIELGARVAETVGIVGPANVQCFREPDGSLPVTDVNPRFGGGFPLPLAAGSRYPGARPRARARRAAGAPARRLPRGRRDDALLLRHLPGGERRRDAAAGLARRWPATSSPVRPASSARTSPRRCWSRATTWSASTASRTTTTPPSEGGERARARRAPARPGGRRARLRRLRRRLPPRRPAGVRSFGDVFELYLGRNIARLAACLRGGGATACGSSSRRRRPSTVRRIAFPTPETEDAGPGLALRDHEARRRAPRPGVRAELRARRRRPPLLQRLRPAPAAGHGVHADRPSPSRAGAVRPLRRRRSVARGFTYVADVVEATIARDEAAPGRPYNVGGGAEVTMLRGDRDPRGARGTPTSGVARHPAVPGDQRRTQADTSADPRRAGLAARAWASSRASRAQWDWAAGRVAAR